MWTIHSTFWKNKSNELTEIPSRRKFRISTEISKHSNRNLDWMKTVLKSPVQSSSSECIGKLHQFQYEHDFQISIQLPSHVLSSHLLARWIEDRDCVQCLLKWDWMETWYSLNYKPFEFETESRTRTIIKSRILTPVQTAHWLWHCSLVKVYLMRSSPRTAKTLSRKWATTWGLWNSGGDKTPHVKTKLRSWKALTK